MGEFVARNMLGWFKKINKQKSCCILLVVYIVIPALQFHAPYKPGLLYLELQLRFLE